MKKHSCFLLCALMIVTLAACGIASEPATVSPSATPQESASTERTVDAMPSAIPETVRPDPTPDNADEEPSAAPETVAPAPEPTAPENAPNVESSAPEKVDLDLTALSSTMVYAEVYNIMMMPEDYVGKRITMEGLFYVDQGYDENWEIDPNVMYFYCIIEDATACCAQGIEFVLADESAVYPEDYPAAASEITVTGEFQAYTEHNYTYYHLINATMSVKQS